MDDGIADDFGKGVLGGVGRLAGLFWREDALFLACLSDPSALDAFLRKVSSFASIEFDGDKSLLGAWLQPPRSLAAAVKTLLVVLDALSDTAMTGVSAAIGV